MEQTIDRTQKLQLAEALLKQKLGLTGESAPVSKGQEGLFLQYRLSPESCAYHLNFCARIDDHVDTAILRRAFAILQDKHSILQTSYSEITTGPLKVAQQVKKDPDGSWTTHDVSEMNEERIERLIHEHSARPFDLENGKVMRVDYFQAGSGQDLLLVSIHHIAMDYWSLGILLNELGAIYTDLMNGRGTSLGLPGTPYSEFAKWQSRLLASPEGRKSLDYWKETLSGSLPYIDLPTDYPRGETIDFAGRSHPFVLDQSTVDGIKGLAMANGTTTYVIMMAFYYLLLRKYSGQADIIIGSPIAGRSSAKFKDTIGYFVNMLPIRITADGNPSFPELVAQIKEISMKGIAHGDIPFFSMVKELQSQRSNNRTPVFQVSLSFEKPTSGNKAGNFLIQDEGTMIRSGNLSLQPVQVPIQASQYEMSMYLEEVNGALVGQIHYQTSLFKEETIQRLSHHYVQLITEVLDKPNETIGRYPLITQEEKERILTVWNNPKSVVASEETLHQRIGKRAAEHPAQIAVTYEDKVLTYGDLHLKSSKLAAFLQAKGIGPEVKVPIILKPSIGMIIAMLAVLQAGGTYVPINHSTPEERIAEIIEDIQAAIVISESELAGKVQDVEAFYMDGDWEPLESCGLLEANSAVTAQNTAYIIYTSGSTGKPKGVMVSHYNAIRLFTSTEPWYSFSEKDTWTLFHSFSFDFSVWEIFGALLHGGRLVIVPYYVTREPQAFYKLLSTEGVTVLNQTPSAFKQLMNADEILYREYPLSLKYVIFGGEALDLKSLKPWFGRHGDKQPSLVNMYGITETTVHVTYRPVSIADTESDSGSLIGAPIPDLQLYLLDDYQNLVPVGVCGEIYVGGAGVSKGYFNRKELTEEKFTPDFIAGIPGNRLYRSGDLGRYLPNGDIEYLGRKDSQVKLRGFRIELGDIQSKILDYEGIKDAVVLVEGTQDEDKKIVAYVTLKDQVQLDSRKLRQFLKGKLPDYMIPSAFMAIEQIPLNTNGKVDRANLPAISYGTTESEGYVAPENELQRTIARLWSEVLSIEEIGIEHPFFDLGGNSILLMELNSKIKEQLDPDITIADLFQYSTVSALAEFIEGKQAEHRGPVVTVPEDRSDKLQLRRHAVNRRAKL